MEQNICNVPTGTKTGPSVEEFQRKLHRWFEDQGLLSDLRAHMRQLIIAALKGTQLAPQAGQSMHQSTSPKIQAINLLVAEFLLLQECHYTLSVFTSEVPLLRNLPEFSPSFKDAAKNKLTTKNSGEVHASPSRLQERRVWDILEALGFSPDSSAGKAVFKSYEESNGEPLLTCLIRSVSKVVRHGRKKEKLLTEENISVSDNDSFLVNTENADSENDKNDKKMSVIREILQKLNVKPKYMKRIENEIKRLIVATQLAEQENFHEKLLSYEKRIQEERAHYEKELYSQIMLAQQQLVGQNATLATGSRSLETQVNAAIEKLQRNLRLVEEKDKRKEQEYLKKKMTKKESTLPKEKRDTLDNRQQEIRHRSKSKKSTEKEATAPSVQQVECQHDTGQILEEKSSCATEVDTNEEQGQMTITSSKSQLESSVSSRDQSVQVGKPGWQVISDFEEIRATVQRLQRENEELQNLMRHQQVQVSELRTWGRLHLAPSVSRSPAQTHLVAPADPNPSAPPSPPPPPLPPRVPQQRVLYPPGDGVLHFRATGATCVAPASTQTPASGRPRTRRLRRFATPRRVLHSSEDTSPTEDMLRDARRRLRQLEEESEAVDRSYREFCLRQQRATPVSDVLAGLLQPPVKTECPLNNGPNTTDATGDPSGLKLLTPFPPRAGNFSSESLVTTVVRTEAEVSHITSETQNTTVQHITRPTVTLNSNVCLSDLIYEIPSSEIVSQQSVSARNQGTLRAIAETHTDTYQTAKMEVQSEVHTTHVYKTPLLSSTIGKSSANADNFNNSLTAKNFDTGCGNNKHKNTSPNATIYSTNEGMTVPEENNVCVQRYNAFVTETVDSSAPSAMKKEENKAALIVYQAKTTTETVHSNAKGPDSPHLVTPLENTLKILKDSEDTQKGTEKQRIGVADENVIVKLYEQKPLKTLVLTDAADKPHVSHNTEAKSEASSKNVCQTTAENGDAQLMEPQASPKQSFNGVELTRSRLSSFISRTRLSELALFQESSEEVQDNKVVNNQEKDSKNVHVLHKITDIASGRISLGDAEFIPASSGDQLFAPTCDSDTETEPEPEPDPGTSKSDVLSINDHHNCPNYGTGEQAISNASVSSEQPISAGKSVSSHGNDFW